MELKKCEICNKEFTSNIGEPYCETCAKEFEEQSDLQVLTEIIGRRGVDWLESAVTQQIASCHNCGRKLVISAMSQKKIYEGTDCKEDSPINYPTALFCQKCYGQA